MFDESSHNVNPIAPLPKKTPPPIAPPEATVTPAPQPLMAPYPLWLRFTTSVFTMIVFWRLCSITSQLNNPLDMVLQSLHVAALMVILVGLWGLRRWAGRMFVFFCFWTAFSGIVIGVARLQYLDVVELPMDRSSVMFGIITDIGFGLVAYGLLGAWYLFNLKYFTPAGTNRYGNIPFVLLIGTMILYTATQVGQARESVILRAEAVEDSRSWMNSWLD